MDFEIVSPIERIEVIATGRGIRERVRLNRAYGAARWRKMKGFAWIKFGTEKKTRYEELHWYEAHGIGRREFKIKFR